MSDEENELEVFEMADEFIQSANRFVNEQNQDVGRVGAAIRYAAARFNAHDANCKSDDLIKDKDNAIDWYTEQYKKMLIENIDELIELTTQENEKNT